MAGEMVAEGAVLGSQAGDLCAGAASSRWRSESAVALRGDPAGETPADCATVLEPGRSPGGTRPRPQPSTAPMHVI
jgi:hypothetical protein